MKKMKFIKPLNVLNAMKAFNAMKTLNNLKELNALNALNVLNVFIKDYWLLFFFIASTAYLELLYRLWIIKGLSTDFLFPFLFSFSFGTLLYLIISLLPAKACRITAAVVSSLLSLLYAVQIIYFCVFRTPLSLYSIGGAGNVVQFIDIIAETILRNILVILLLFVPLVILLFKKGPLFAPMKRITAAFVLLFCIAGYSTAIICVNLTGDGPSSQKTLYYSTLTPDLSIGKLGLLTTMRLDFQRLVADSLENTFAGQATATSNRNDNRSSAADKTGGTGSGAGSANTGTASGGEFESTASEPASASVKAVEPTSTSYASSGDTGGGGDAGSRTDAAEMPPKSFQVMNIDFDKLLAASGKDKNLDAMNKFFSTVNPTSTNEYTGMFKGDNLILITAEAFSPYFITPDLTPTLYKMEKKGFVFRNFYNPVWGVSTSDGEYVACTGLIPKSGVWSFFKSGSNLMPFCMGNQFSKLGYTTKAYHDHTYTYYKRNISHPNMGYDYKGYGNGLVVKKTWPESDLEMINVTAGDFTTDKPFHIYYMTVSGHMNYSFSGNYMAAKNKKLVENLPYSDPSKAYIACNLELEFAMKALIEKLEAAGIAEKTVIAISGDHYPYGLPRECIDELAGHKVEDNFELYKSTFILWKKGMETVVVDKPCASLDRIPTLSNLFGLEYDSRLMMGTDIFSDSPALVIFSNRSWITDRARYNTVTNQVEFFDGTVEDKAYIRMVNRIVADKFKYSTKILETDYYRKVFGSMK